MELIRIKSLLRLTAVRQKALRSFHRAEQVQQAARLEEERQKAEPKVESYPAFLTLGISWSRFITLLTSKPRTLCSSDILHL